MGRRKFCGVKLPAGGICGRSPLAGNDRCALHAETHKGLIDRTTTETTESVDVRIQTSPGRNSGFLVQAISDDGGHLQSLKIIAPKGSIEMKPAEESLLALVEVLQAIEQEF